MNGTEPDGISLTSLLEVFRPKKTYKEYPFTIKVDSVFLRIDETLRDQVAHGKTGIVTDIADLLQDYSVVRSARVSTGREEKNINEAARGLIGRLYKDWHITPFEGGVFFKFVVTTPICFAETFFQLPGSHNEFSGRYSNIDGDFYLPQWASQNQNVENIFREAEEDSRTLYGTYLNQEVAKEQARLAMLFRFFTKFYWTISLRHLLEFLSVERYSLVPDEVWDMRDSLITGILRDWTPWIYDEFIRHPRKIRTGWVLDFMPFKSLFAENLKAASLKTAKIENIGHLSLLDVHKQPEVQKLGFMTKPNPWRGFAHSSMTFLIEDPVFVHRQWVRHRNGVWGEIPPDFDDIVKQNNFYIPLRFRQQTGKNMDYRYEDSSDKKNEIFILSLGDLIVRSKERYKKLRSMRISPERAALVLPYAFRVERLWTVNIESLFNYLSLRCDEHAQWETRMFARQVYLWFKEYFPLENKYFLSYFNFGTSDLFRN